MSRRRKKKKNQNQSSSTPQTRQIPFSYTDAEAVIRQSEFDAMSDTIRGEELLRLESAKKEKEARDVKKKLDKVEVDRKLEKLRDQLGLPKK